MDMQGKFFYSAKQREIIDRSRVIECGHTWHNFCKLDSGEVVEYTEWKHTDNVSNFDDAVFLGEGEYDHREQIAKATGNVLSNDRVTSILEHVPCDAKEEDLIRAGYHSRDAEISEHHIVISNLRDALIAEHKKLAKQAEIVRGLVEALESIPVHTLDHAADGTETMVFRYNAYAIWDTEKRLPAIAKAKRA